MIFIVVKWPIKAEHADAWPDVVDEFTRATRAEEGNLFFEWSRSVEDPTEYVLVEASRDGAGEAHVSSAHFARAMERFPDYIAAKPKIVSRQVDGDGWDEMGELTPR